MMSNKMVINQPIVQNEKNANCFQETRRMNYDRAQSMDNLINTSNAKNFAKNVILKRSNGSKQIEKKLEFNANYPIKTNNKSTNSCDSSINRKETEVNNESKAQLSYKWEIVWMRVLIIAFFHLAGFYGATLRNDAKWQSQIFGRIIAVLSSYSVTAGAHRLWSHNSYKANTAYQIMMMLLMSFVYQNSIYVWARDHRVHHKFSETDADPHNAKRGFFFSHVGWLILKKHPDVRRKGASVDMTDLQANPIVMFQHRHYHKLIFFNCFFIMIFVPWYLWGESLKVAFFYMTAYRLLVILNFTWGINSFAHMYGYKPYNKNIGPVENSLMSYLTFGEGFHNYHHTFPYDYKAGEYSTDGRNTTTKFIDLFARCGWVWDRKVAGEDVIAERKLHGDGYDNCERGWAKRCMDVGRVAFMCFFYGYLI